MPKKERNLTEKDLKKLEDRFEKLRAKEMEFYMEYLQSPWKLFTRTFLVGTAKGLGFFLGSAIIIALLSFLLSGVLSNIANDDETLKQIGTWIEQNAQER